MITDREFPRGWQLSITFLNRLAVQTAYLYEQVRRNLLSYIADFMVALPTISSTLQTKPYQNMMSKSSSDESLIENYNSSSLILPNSFERRIILKHGRASRAHTYS